ncbi:MAG: class I SAM-dependent methyltransferase [Synergistaceae bacterium]|jgi:predicted O-methyltransferase YrrM|nr:class I SAM-dependent methyltransferase [Synergistaceae bacterium]
MLRLKDLDFVPERYEAERLERVEGAVEGPSEMLRVERLFLNGLVRRLEPKKLLEVGVAAGGSSCVLLNAMDDGAVLHSVDWSGRYYRDKAKATGWLVDEVAGERRHFDTTRWRRHFDRDVSEVIEEIGGGVDFALLDTVHAHPAETLSFISIFPFLTPDAVVVLHDVNLFFSNPPNSGYDAYATKLLFDIVTADKFTPSEFGNGYIHPNIAAFQVNGDTRKYIADVFRSHFFPWGYDVPERVLSGTKHIIREQYGERERERERERELSLSLRERRSPEHGVLGAWRSPLGAAAAQGAVRGLGHRLFVVESAW